MNQSNKVMVFEVSNFLFVKYPSCFIDSDLGGLTGVVLKDILVGILICDFNRLSLVQYNYR